MFKIVYNSIWDTLYYGLYCMDVKFGLSPLEEQRIRVLENNVLRKIFGTVRDMY